MASLYKEKRFYNFREIILNGAEKFADNTAYVVKKGEGEYINIKYADLKKYYYSFCTYLIEKGMLGQKIAVMGANSFQWALSYLCAATVGVVVPIDKELQPEDVNAFLESADCKMVCTDSTRIEKLKGIAAENMLYTDFADVLDIASSHKADEAAVNAIEIGEHETRIIIFTSGTTGNSKGVCLSQNNICSNIYSTVQMVKVNDFDSTLSILPLHHTYECTLNNVLFLTRGACITYCDGLTKVAKNIAEYQPSILVVVPALLKVLNKRIKAGIIKDCPSLYRKYFETLSLAEALKKCPFFIRKIICKKVKKTLGGKIRLFIVGAADLDTSLVEDFGALGIRTLQGYGLTECAPLLAGNNDFHLNKASTGPAIPDVQLKIDDPNDEGVGEILAKGDNIMLGYFNDPEATEAVFRDGWFCTGDLGCIDSNGDLYIKGRIKNVIVTENGKNIYPEELETRLAEYPEIGEALVYASDENGETCVKAKIFPNLEYIKERFGGEKPSEEDIKKTIQNAIKSVNSKIPNYKHIKIVEVLSSALEKTTTQKIKRFGKNVK